MIAVNRLWLALALAMASSMSSADFTIKYDSHDGAQKAQSTIYISGGKLRIDNQTSQGDNCMLYDRSSDEATLLMPAQKQYMELGQTAETLGQVQDKMSSMMESAMQNASPENKAMMEKMLGKMGGLMPQKPAAEPVKSYVKTGSSEKVDGFACKNLEFRVNEKPSKRFCLADAGDLGMSASDFSTLQAFMLKTANMAKQVSRFSPEAARATVFDGKLDGVPLRVQDLEVPAGTSGSTMVSAEHSANPPGGFVIPTDYSPMTLSIPKM